MQHELSLLQRPCETIRRVGAIVDTDLLRHRVSSALLDAAPDAIVIVDARGQMRLVNERVKQLLGYEARDLIGKSLEEELVPERLRSAHRKHRNSYNRNPRPRPMGTELNLCILKKDGTELPVDISLGQLDTEEGPMVAAFIRDVTEKRALDERLRYLVNRDVLTDLYNRSFFELECDRLNNSRSFPISVIFIDIDGLKTANDTFGHAAGDELLRFAANALKECFRREEIVARYGGDEFVVLLPNTDARALQQVLARLRRRLQRVDARERNPPLRWSAGGDTASGPGTLRESVRRADRRMYQEKPAVPEMPTSADPNSEE